MSKVHADKMNHAAKSFEQEFYRIDSPQRLLHTVNEVKFSYEGMNAAMVHDWIISTNQAIKSDNLHHEAVNER